MEEKIKTVETGVGELRFYREWKDSEGGIVMINPQTIRRYKELKEMQPNSDECGVFFAFDNFQFDEGYKRLIELGHIKDGDKVTRTCGGMFGTKNGIDAFFSFYRSVEEKIKAECDPQEVYFHEFNNHECQIAWDGDLNAIKVVIGIWGADVARGIERYNVSMSVDDLVRKPVDVEGLYFTIDGERKLPNHHLWFNDSGYCYTMWGGILHSVHVQGGEQYRNADLSGLSAEYDGRKIHGFYKE